LDVAYDQETAGGATYNALVFTELIYKSNTTPATTWKQRTGLGYPQYVSKVSGTIYQEPGFAQDQDGNLWLADLEMQLSANPATGGIALYQRKNGTWGSVAVNIPNNTMPPNTPPQSLITLDGSNAFAHAPRPVFVSPSTNNPLFGTIGLLFQGPSSSNDCLYWTMITGDSASGATATTPLELSQYSSTPGQCNLPSIQGTYPDTAYSVATDLITGDQYLGFVINDGTGGTVNEAVFALSYNGTTNTWNTNYGTAFNNSGGNNVVYVKSVYATDSNANTYSFMIVNQGVSTLELYSSPTLSTTPPYTMYTGIDNLTYNNSLGTFSNPRIEAPQYVNSNSTFTTVPIWLQYTDTSMMGSPQSLLYWNQVPN
jgi:hypothetical protein